MVARGLSPLDPSAGAIKAGRLLLGEVRESIDGHETFALESTLSGKTYVRIFERALSSGYDLELHYLWLSNVEQAIARVRRRVRMGGHNVPVNGGAGTNSKEERAASCRRNEQFLGMRVLFVLWVCLVAAMSRARAQDVPDA